MTCRTFRNLCVISLCGKLTAGEKESLEKHLASCPHCKTAFQKAGGWEAAEGLPPRNTEAERPDWEVIWAGIGAGLPNGETSVREAGRAPRLLRWAALAGAAAAVFFSVFRPAIPPRPDASMPASLRETPPPQSERESLPIRLLVQQADMIILDILHSTDPGGEEPVFRHDGKLLRSLIQKTRALKDSRALSDRPETQAVMNELEACLISLANADPNDREARDFLAARIRETGFREKLIEMAAEGTE